jgi:hypothetical protein
MIYVTLNTSAGRPLADQQDLFRFARWTFRVTDTVNPALRGRDLFEAEQYVEAEIQLRLTATEKRIARKPLLGSIRASWPLVWSMSSIKRDVKKKVLPRPEGEKILSRDPAHFTVRVPLDLRERFRF